MPPPDAVPDQRENHEQIQTLIQTLLPRRQAVITPRFFGGLQNQEISQILALDERTVAAHLCRGLKDLEKKLTARAIASKLD